MAELAWEPWLSVASRTTGQTRRPDRTATPTKSPEIRTAGQLVMRTSFTMAQGTETPTLGPVTATMRTLVNTWCTVLHIMALRRRSWH